MNNFYANGSGLFEDDPTHIRRAQELTEWFDKGENDVKHILWSSLSPDLNPVEHLFWSDALYQHHQNTHRERAVFSTPVQFKRFVECAPRNTEAVLVVMDQDLTNTLAVFTFNLSPVCFIFLKASEKLAVSSCLKT